MEFLHIDWLKQILQWQKPNGCYGQMKVSNFGKKYNIQDKTNYIYDNPNSVNFRNMQGMQNKMQPDIVNSNDGRNFPNSNLNNLEFQMRDMNVEPAQQDKFNGLVNRSPVGMSNNVVVQQGVGVENKLQMKVTNISANGMKPAAEFNNVVNVGAGQALPMHDLDIKANDEPGNVQNNQHQPMQGNLDIGRNFNPNLQNFHQNNFPPPNNDVKPNNIGQVGQNNIGGLVPGPIAAAQGGPAPVEAANPQDQHVDPLDPLKWQRPFDQKKPKDYQGDRILLRKLLVEKDLGCKYLLCISIRLI